MAIWQRMLARGVCSLGTRQYALVLDDDNLFDGCYESQVSDAGDCRKLTPTSSGGHPGDVCCQEQGQIGCPARRRQRVRRSGYGVA